uniref:Protein B0024.10 n=2 Tax=Haemonchus contortus TaxID=6289 RepID=A0A7I4YQS0_HAECO
MSSVTVLCPNAKRCPVRVTPSMLMKQVLEEACLKNGFDADEYKLLNQNRHIDLALPFRLSGLPNNATLEMVKATKNVSNSLVTIALQLPSGSRMEGAFPISSSLFEMLAFFSQSANEDLTATDDSSTPTCSYMNRQYTGPVELQSTTFSSIGISTGKCLIRYQRVPLSKEQQNEIAARIANDAAEKKALLANYERMKAENENRAQLEAARLKRFEEELRLEEERKKSADAMAVVEELVDTNNQFSQSINPGFSRDILQDPPRNQTGWSFDAPVFSTMSSSPSVPDNRLSNLSRLLQQVDTSLSRPQSEHDRLTDILAQEGRVPLSRIAIEATRSEESEEAPPVSSPASSTPPCERQPVVFQRRMKFEWNDMEAGLSDDFFEVSVDDVKARQKELREEVRLSTQRALISTQYVKQKNRERKLTAYRHTVIRIPLGNERMIQAQFLSAEPVARLFEWIRSIISRDIPFSIKLALIYNIEESQSMNFVDAELAPKSTVVVRFRDSMSFESLLLKDKLQECSQDEADRLSSIWLSVNSMFKPYTAVIEEEERITKRPGGTRDSTNSEYAPPPEKTSSAPRWLRRN